MAYTIPVGTRQGQVDNAGAVDALFYSTFAGLVLREFQAARIASNLIRHKWAIKGASGRHFRLMGSAAAKFHTRGESIMHSGDYNVTPGTDGYLSKVAQAKLEVKLSDTLLSATSVDELETLKNEFDEKKDLAGELGRALAEQDELYTFLAILKASGAADSYTGQPAAGGTIDITGWTAKMASTDSEDAKSALYNAFFAAQKTLNKGNVSRVGRVAVIHSDYMDLLVSNTKLQNKDWGGVGTVAEGTAPRLAGFQILESNLFPTSNIVTPAAEKNDLDLDCSDFIGCFFTADAAGRVSGKEVTPNVRWEEDILQWILSSRMAVGHGPVRRECAITLKKTAL